MNNSDMEKAIALQLVTDAIAAGYTIDVWNGGDEAEATRLDNVAAVTKELMHTDEDKLVIRKADGQAIGWVYLVYGNGADVITDYTANEETRSVCRRAEVLAGGFNARLAG